MRNPNASFLRTMKSFVTGEAMRTIVSLMAIGVLVGCGKSADQSSNEVQVTESQKTVATPAPAPTKWDGPFGLAMGLTVEQLEKAGISLKELEPGIFSGATAPAPNGKFESYTYVINDKTGLCKVAGIGKDLQANAFGAQVKDVFDDLEQALTSKYGKPSSTFKFVRAGSIWKEDKYWMMGLTKKERIHDVTWIDGEKGVALPDLASIALRASASDIATGYVTLNYEFPNVSECLKANKAKANESL